MSLCSPLNILTRHADCHLYLAGGLTSSTDASRDASYALASLAAMAEAGGVDAVRHAVRQASALTSLVALLGVGDEAVQKPAMRLLAQLDPNDNASTVADSGGIVLLCETLASPASADANRLQAVRPLARPLALVSLRHLRLSPFASSPCVLLLPPPPIPFASTGAYPCQPLCLSGLCRRHCRLR